MELIELLPVVPLGHAGEGATWQALLTSISIGVGVVFLLVVSGRLEVQTPGDLVVPLSVVAVISALAPVASDVLSDWVGYAFPAGMVGLAALLLAAASRFELTRRALPALAVLALAGGASAAAGPSLTLAWHPPPVLLELPPAGDAQVRLVTPEDGATLPAGPVDVVVAVSGGTIGPPVVLPENAPAGSPQELGHVRLFVNGLPVAAQADDCTVSSPCLQVGFRMGLQPGVHDLVVEFVAWDGLPFDPVVTTRATITVE